MELRIIIKWSQQLTQLSLTGYTGFVFIVAYSLNSPTEKLESLQTDYHKTNVDSEPYSTTDNDFRRALVQERRRHDWRENGMGQKDCEEKEIESPNNALKTTVDGAPQG